MTGLGRSITSTNISYGLAKIPVSISTMIDKVEGTSLKGICNVPECLTNWIQYDLFRFRTNHKITDMNSLSGLDLDYKSSCKCGYCRINKNTYQKLIRFIYGRFEFSVSSQNNLLWN